MRSRASTALSSSSGRVNTHEKKLSTFVRKQLTSILFYSAILVALGLLSSLWLRPLINNTFEAWKIPAIWGNLLGIIATLLIMAPFLWALAVKNVNRERIRKMLHTYNHSQVAVIPLLALRYFITLFIVGWVVSTYVHLAVGLLVVVAIVIVMAVLMSRRATDFYNRIEDHFVTNFYQRQAQNSFKIPESLEKNFLMDIVVILELIYCTFQSRITFSVIMRVAYRILCQQELHKICDRFILRSECGSLFGHDFH